MTLNILSGYNNYYNRLLKMEETIEEYIQKCDDYFQAYDINFNPNDNIHTDHIIGQGDFNGVGDYLVVTNDSNEIVSRWFIMESQRTRAGQYKLLLRRDVIADYYNIIVESPVFIEKSMLPVNSPLLFNKENMSFNQIKTNEHLLKDKSGCPWLVGYYDKNMTGFTGTARTNTAAQLRPLHIGNDLTAFKYYEFTNISPTKTKFGGAPYDQYFVIKIRKPTQEGKAWALWIYGDLSYSLVPTAFPGPAFDLDPDVSEQVLYDRISAWLNTQKMLPQYDENRLFIDLWRDIYPEGPHCEIIVEDFLFYDGIIVADNSEENVYYSKVITEGNKRLTDYVMPYGSRTDNIIRNSLLKDLFVSNRTDSSTSYLFFCQYQTYSLEWEPLTFGQVTYTIPDSGKLLTDDAPYNIFAIPYGEVQVNGPASLSFKTNKDTAFKVAAAIVVAHGQFVYDIQLLPYCPMQSLLGEDGSLNLNSSEQYSLIGGIGGNESIILNIPASKVEFNISLKLPIGETAIERKVNNECDKWRLASPNYADFFDFSVEMNDGVEYFNVDCEFKPYTPYIHVNPNFKNLYGSDFNGPRGLVCGGDFSLTRVDNQWVNYQIQNKNYEKIFGRQIQNMEVQHQAQSFQTAANAVVGTVSGITSGIMAGSMMGGLAGGIVGGIVGGAASAFGGAVDYQVEKMLQKETLDYTQDMYNYQLDNIQALPQTISKISSFNNNNKIFPILEYYTCTDQEKNALRNKIKYNGMTTMVIDTLSNYAETPGAYIKGKLVRLEGINDDYHIVNIISEELNKGFFTPEIQIEGEQ